ATRRFRPHAGRRVRSLRHRRDGGTDRGRGRVTGGRARLTRGSRARHVRGRGGGTARPSVPFPPRPLPPRGRRVGGVGQGRRAALVAMLLAASPYLLERDMGPMHIELALLVGLVGTAVLARRLEGRSLDTHALTGGAELGRHAPA